MSDPTQSMAMRWSSRVWEQPEPDPAPAYAAGWRQMSSQVKPETRYFVLVDYRIEAEFRTVEEAFKMQEFMMNLMPEVWSAVWMNSGAGAGSVALRETAPSRDPERLRRKASALRCLEEEAEAARRTCG